MIQVVGGDEAPATGLSEGGLSPHYGGKECLQSEMSFVLFSLLPYVVFVLSQADQILHLLQLLLSQETGLLKERVSKMLRKKGRQSALIQTWSKQG